MQLMAVSTIPERRGERRAGFVSGRKRRASLVKAAGAADARKPRGRYERAAALQMKRAGGGWSTVAGARMESSLPICASLVEVAPVGGRRPAPRMLCGRRAAVNRSRRAPATPG